MDSIKNQYPPTSGTSDNNLQNQGNFPASAHLPRSQKDLTQNQQPPTQDPQPEENPNHKPVHNHRANPTYPPHMPRNTFQGPSGAPQPQVPYYNQPSPFPADIAGIPGEGDDFWEDDSWDVPLPERMPPPAPPQNRQPQNMPMGQSPFPPFPPFQGFPSRRQPANGYPQPYPSYPHYDRPRAGFPPPPPTPYDNRDYDNTNNRYVPGWQRMPPPPTRMPPPPFPGSGWDDRAPIRPTPNQYVPGWTQPQPQRLQPNTQEPSRWPESDTSTTMSNPAAHQADIWEETTDRQSQHINKSESNHQQNGTPHIEHEANNLHRTEEQGQEIAGGLSYKPSNPEAGPTENLQSPENSVEQAAENAIEQQETLPTQETLASVENKAEIGETLAPAETPGQDNDDDKFVPLALSAQQPVKSVPNDQPAPTPVATNPTVLDPLTSIARKKESEFIERQKAAHHGPKPTV